MGEQIGQTEKKEKRNVIYALATGAPPAAIGVIRLTGAGVFDIVHELTGGKVPCERHAALRLLRADDVLLDEAVVIYFSSPRSYTGEDMAELHCHGGELSLRAVLDALANMEGVRMAQAGEMTKRAFLNGRLDVTKIEGLADLMNARTETQRILALQSVRGARRKRLDEWRKKLSKILALYEAMIDFSEDDLPAHLYEDARRQLTSLCDDLRSEIQRRDGEQLRQGVRIVLAGAPNAGKSTLMNALTQKETSITHDRAGTTRDVIKQECVMDGQLITFFDTAGLASHKASHKKDEIEQEGIRRSHQSLKKADGCLWLCAHDAPLKTKWLADNKHIPSLIIVNKKDCQQSDAFYEKVMLWSQDKKLAPPLLISAKQGEGLEEIKTWLLSHILSHQSHKEPAVITRARVRHILLRVVSFLQEAQGHPHGAEELTAQSLRDAFDALGEVTGHGGAEEILDKLFAELCIGK